MASHKSQKENIAVLVQNGYGGGAERMAANMTLALSHYYNVYYVLFDGEGIIYEYAGKKVDLRIPPIKERGAFKRASNTIKRVAAVRKLKKELKLKAVISHLNGADLVNVLSGKGFAGNRCRVICVFHSMPSVDEPCNAVYKFLHRLIGSFADRYICVSKMAACDMNENFGVKKRDLSVIYNFSDLSRIESLMKKQLPDDFETFRRSHGKLIINVGRMEKVKRQERLVKLLLKLRDNGFEDAGLVILGDGPLRTELVSLASQMHLSDHIFMPGNVSNPFMYMAASDLFVLCSDYEGLPMVLTEAAACGLPCVSCDMPSGAREILAPDTDINEHAEDIEYAKYGVLTRAFRYEGGGRHSEDNGDPAGSSLYKACEEMLADKTKTERYIKTGMECAERFSEKKAIGRWIKLIEN